MQTYSGLVDRGFYDAFTETGPLKWTNSTNTEAIKVSDRGLARSALLSGGVISQVVAFDLDAVKGSQRYPDNGDVDMVIAANEYTDLQYLATICSRNKLGVIPPSSLPSADANVLTLNREGLLAVYVGREACGEPGRDINIFSPTKNPCVAGVDVAIVTQTLVPILNHRNADGTAVFEAFGDRHRRMTDPEELIMLIVDTSASMGDRCGFIEVEEAENGFDPPLEDSEDESDPDLEDVRYERPALDELKGRSDPVTALSTDAAKWFVQEKNKSRVYYRWSFNSFSYSSLQVYLTI